MNSLPTISTYETEAENNNSKVIEMFEGLVPGNDLAQNMDTLLKVNSCINQIRQHTSLGQVIVHIQGTETNVEYRGNFLTPPKK